MLVCHCRAVSHREIVRAARCGASSPEEVAKICGAGGDCGGCVDSVIDLLDEVAANLQPSVD